MRTTVSTGLGLAALLSLAGVASADIMTFDNMPPSFMSPPYVEGNITLASTNGGFFFRNNYGNGAPSVGASYTALNYRLTMNNSPTFQLNSMDIRIFAGTSTQSTTVIGYLAGGGTVSQVVTAPSNFAWLTVNFDNSWTNLARVEWVSELVVFDNLNVTAPTPGAAALAGLGSLATLRRRRRA